MNARAKGVIRHRFLGDSSAHASAYCGVGRAGGGPGTAVHCAPSGLNANGAGLIALRPAGNAKGVAAEFTKPPPCVDDDAAVCDAIGAGGAEGASEDCSFDPLAIAG